MHCSNKTNHSAVPRCALLSSGSCVPIVFTASAATVVDLDAGQRLHNSVAQREHGRARSKWVKIRGGSRFPPHQTCCVLNKGGKRTHGLLPDHTVFSAASWVARSDRIWTSTELVGCQTFVVSPSSCIICWISVFFTETECTVNMSLAPWGSSGMFFWSSEMQTYPDERSGSWNGKFPRSLVCSRPCDLSFKGGVVYDLL